MKNLITILGPTATGKTKLAAALAAVLNGEIISADSRQVYRGMDIGTGKDLEDYTYQGVSVPYHLIDIVDPGFEYNIFEYQKDFVRVFNSITSRGKLPVLAGGSGMYLDAVLNGYELVKVPEDPFLRKKLEKLSDDQLRIKLKELGKVHNTTDLLDRERLVRAIEIREYEKRNPDKKIELPEIDSVNVGIHFERNELRARITERLVYRLKNGMIEEVERLLQTLSPEQLMFYGLEYKWVTKYVIGEIDEQEMFARLNTAIHQFAKRQVTWYRRMEKRGMKIFWIDGHLTLEEKLGAVLKIIR
jgi:tRNA dimethylallyltransferase